MTIETFESEDGPRWRLRARNAEILATSEAYSSKAKRDKTVQGIYAALGDYVTLRLVEL